MKKIAAKLITWLFAGILLLVGGAIVWILYTNSGLNWSLQKINQATDGMLKYGRVTGAWLTTFEFDHLNIDISPVTIKSEHPRFQLRIKKILSGTLEVEAFHASYLTVRNQPEPPKTSEQILEKPSGAKFALPVTILVNSLSVDKFSYQEEDQTPLDFENVSGGDARIHNEIEIGRFSAQTSYGSATAHGTIVPVKNGKMDLDTEFVINATENTPELRGAVKLEGTFNVLTFHAKLTHPSEIVAEAKLDSTQSPITWSLKASAASVPLQGSFPQLPVTLANLTLTGGGSFENYSVEGTTHLAVVNNGEWDLKWNATKNNDHWAIENLDLNNVISNTQLSAKGSVSTGYSFNASTPFTVMASWKNAQWPLVNTAIIASKTGSLRAQGSINHYQLAVDGAFRWSDKEITNIVVNGVGNLNKLDLNRVAGDYEGGHVDGSGSGVIGGETSWKAQANVNALDLSGFYSGLKTNLNAKVDMDGAYKQDKFSGSFSISGLKGTVNKKPVAGKGKVAIDGSNIQVSGLSLTSGNNHLAGRFEYLSEDASSSSQINADWNLNLQDLGLLDTTAKGSINSRGSISGEPDKLSGKVTLNANGVSFEEYKIKKLKLDTGFDFTDKTTSHIRLTATQASISGIPLETLEFNIKGMLSQHSIDVKIIEGRDNILTLDGLGHWENSQWKTIWMNSQLESKHFGTWRQSKQTTLTVGTSELKLTQYCFSKDQESTLCGLVRGKDYQYWDGSLTFAHIPFEMFTQFLPPQFASTAVNLNGHGDFSYTPSAGVIMQFNAEGKDGVISGIKVEDVVKQIPFSHFSFDVSNKDEELQAKSSIDFENTGNVNIELSFPGWSKLSVPDPNQKIKGDVIVNLNNLSLLTVVSDQIKEPIGQWHSDITVAGTLGAPVLLGESKLTASSLTLVRLGLKLTDVNFVAKSNEKRVVNVTGTAKSGGGSLNISGYLNDYRAAETSGLIKISGKNFQMANIPEALIIGSPDLSVSLNQNTIKITGDVLINEADLKLFTPVKTIAPSPDVVIVSEKAPEAQQPAIKILSKIRVVLGKKVKIQGFGFTGGLEGSLLLDDTHAVPTASGEIKILNGKYVAYGTELDISEGRLSFAGGAIDNPLIDVRAEKHPGDNITVGLVVEGTVKSPKISLFSQPAMEDSDILSYLLVGSPLGSASKQQGQMLANAAASLGLIGGEKLAKKIGEKFGIDEIKLQTDKTTQDTSLLLGKYLSPDFYIGYAVGIGNAVNTLQIQYKLTDQWMLKTQSGQTQKAEILFSIEKD